MKDSEDARSWEGQNAATKSSADSFVETAVDPPVRGFIHPPTSANRDGIVLTHGAGSNSKTPLLTALADAFVTSGFAVLRCDLPFRQARPYGPPRPGDAIRDREGLKNAVSALRKEVSGRIYLGGHSYGGRQATILAAAEPAMVDGLLLLSYPLHPPRKPLQLRTQHFPKLETPAIFVHGARDPFGSITEMESALELIPAKHLLLPVPGAGHDLGFKGKVKNEELTGKVLILFETLFPFQQGGPHAL
jgi:predicted alpha/beta-hydrolase family hydrolase